MSLSEVATGIVRDTQRLNDQNRLIAEFQNYEHLRTEFDRLRSRIVLTTRSVGLLEEAGIEVPTSSAPPDAIARLEALVSDEASFSENPLADATPALRLLREWIEEQNAQVGQSYRVWVNQLFGDLEGIGRFAEHVAAFDRPKSVRIAGLVSRARAKLNSTPTGLEALEETRQLADDLTAEVESIASSEAQRGYLTALRNEGIALDEISDDFEAWAREKRIWPSLRVKLG